MPKRSKPFTTFISKRTGKKIKVKVSSSNIRKPRHIKTLPDVHFGKIEGKGKELAFTSRRFRKV